MRFMSPFGATIAPATSCTTQDAAGYTLSWTEETVKASLSSEEAITLTVNTVSRSDPCHERRGRGRKRCPSSGILGLEGKAARASLWVLSPFAQFQNLPHLCPSHENKPNRKSRCPLEISQQALKLSYFRDSTGETLFAMLTSGRLSTLPSPPPPRPKGDSCAL